MSDFYACRVVDGRHVVGVTTNGIDFTPIPKAVYDTPRRAVAYANTRQARVSPLRPSDESTGPVVAALGEATHSASVGAT